MDFDKLSLKEQLELSVLKIECYIDECSQILGFSKLSEENAIRRAKEDKMKRREDWSVWEMSAAVHNDNIRVFEKRISEYKEQLYKYKDELYNLKENENLVSSE